MFKILK